MTQNAVFLFCSLFSSDLPKPDARVSMVSWTSDDQYVLTAVTDNSIKVWNANTGTILHTMKVGTCSDNLC